MLSGWLTNLQYYVIIPEIVYLSELFRHITVDCSSTAATLPLAHEVRDQATCLLPNNSNYLYAAVLHLPKNPKLYFGKLLNIQKLHQSFEDSGEATKDDRKIRNDSCSLIRQTISVISKWITKTFFFEKIVKHIILINDRTDQCVIPKDLHETYHKGQKPLIRWLIDKIIFNVTMAKMSHWSHWQYELERKDNIGEQLKNKKNRNIFEGTRLLLPYAIINQTKNGKFVNKTIIKKSLMEFLREIIFESIVADAIFSIDLTNNWIKYDFDDFKKLSQSSIIFQGWTWLLNLLRVMFFIVGAFIMLITTCAICGFACILSSILRDDYFHRRQRREQDEELRILEERLHEAGINIHFNAFNDPPLQFERQSNSETNTAIEQLSTVSFEMKW
uniref:Uncharacterized protein n=2 Tax=Wuchereria bancrofti TaxID=6293 RepID=A0A1I8EYG2_WUCBA